MKAREIRETLQGKVDPKLLHCMCEIAETASAQQQEITELANIMNGIIDNLLKLGVTIESATSKIESIRGEGIEDA
jgi:hypothetical protein